MSNLFVCLMGIGTVFIGLICIILLCVIMGLIFKIFGKSSEKSATASAPAPVSANQTIPDKQKIIAATCVTIAEELGTDVTNIRVVSFKRV